MHHVNVSRTVRILVPALALACLAGCNGSNGNDVSYDAIVSDLSPEMRGTTERPVDVDRNVHITAHLNSRLFWDDLGRFFYTDHPSRLSPLPVNGSSGRPR